MRGFSATAEFSESAKLLHWTVLYPYTTEFVDTRFDYDLHINGWREK